MSSLQEQVNAAAHIQQQMGLELRTPSADERYGRQKQEEEEEEQRQRQRRMEMDIGGVEDDDNDDDDDMMETESDLSSSSDISRENLRKLQYRREQFRKLSTDFKELIWKPFLMASAAAFGLSFGTKALYIYHNSFCL